MTTIGIILTIVAVIIVLPLLAALFLKKDYSVERDVDISRPKAQVFDYIKLLKNQDDFSKWARIDPDMKKSYKGNDGYAGFVSAWESTNKSVGKGEQEIKNIVEGERIDFEVRFEKPMRAVSPAYMMTESLGEGRTKVRWGFQGHMSYPMNLMMVFMNMEKMIGNDLSTGLSSLKTILERK
jgi:hypothetical protein